VRLSLRTRSMRFILALVISSVISEALFTYNALHNHDLDFDYLSYNLILAWLPLLFAIRLTQVLRHKLWSSWEALLFSVLWLLFSPNSFYMISDYIHLASVNPTYALYDALILTSFIYTGVTLGFSSLFLIHLHLRRRLPARQSSFWVATTLLVSSIAIYFGRDLRWSSWDVLTNPGGLLFDVSNRLVHLASYPDMIINIIAFFVLLLAMYNLLWQGAHLFQIRQGNKGVVD